MTHLSEPISTADAWAGSTGRPPVEVAIVALWRTGADGPRVLIAQRSAGRHLAGKWELPGGKVEPGESPDQAARRELLEELRVSLAGLEPLIVVEHAYPDRAVRIHAFIAAADPSATIDPPAGVCWCWAPVRSLAQYDWPAANGPVTQAILARLGEYPDLPGPSGEGAGFEA